MQIHESMMIVRDNICSTSHDESVRVFVTLPPHCQLLFLSEDQGGEPHDSGQHRTDNEIEMHQRGVPLGADLLKLRGDGFVAVEIKIPEREHPARECAEHVELEQQK